MDNAPATTPSKTLKDLILSKQSQYKTLLPAHIPPERFMRIIFTQMQKNKALLQCTQESVLSAVLVAAELGLIPDGRKGALVPFNNKGTKEATFIPMYQGLIELARQTGQIADIFPATVCENDAFHYELGLNRQLEHIPIMKDRGKPIAYYAVVIFKDGTQTFGPGPMTADEVQAIKKRSRASGSGPWITDFEAMAWKTVIKRVLKFCPQSPELTQAMTLDGEHDQDFGGNMIDMDAVEHEQQEIARVNAAIAEQAKEDAAVADEQDAELIKAMEG